MDLRSKLIEWEGKPAFQTIVRNVTDRKRAEEELKKALTFNEAIIDSIPGIVYLYDDTGHLVHFNKKSEEVTGYSGEELQGKQRSGLFQWPATRYVNYQKWHSRDDDERAFISRGQYDHQRRTVHSYDFHRGQT